MIREKELAPVLKEILQEIDYLPMYGFKIEKVVVDRERDPEVEGWEMLSVTLWCHGPPEHAWRCWQKLDEVMKSRRQKLPIASLQKLNRFISVGVDTE